MKCAVAWWTGRICDLVDILTLWTCGLVQHHHPGAVICGYPYLVGLFTCGVVHHHHPGAVTWWISLPADLLPVDWYIILGL